MQRRKFITLGLGAAASFAMHLPRPSFALNNREVSMLTLSNGKAIPMAGLGTYSLKGTTCIDSVYHAISIGYRLIDTAHAYGNEREVGQAVRMAISDGLAKREDITVITKLYPDQYDSPMQAIEEGLGNLGLEWCDIMLLHHPGAGDEAAYRCMEGYVKRGRIRALGLSCFYIRELQRFLPRISIRPVLVQNEIHPYYQDRKVTKYIQDQGIAVQAWYPLGGRGHQEGLFADPVLRSIASKHGRSVAQVMLRWNVQNGVIVIPGSSNHAHQRENLDIFSFALEEEEMNAIASLDRNEKHDWY